MDRPADQVVVVIPATARTEAIVIPIIARCMRPISITMASAVLLAPITAIIARRRTMNAATIVLGGTLTLIRVDSPTRGRIVAHRTGAWIGTIGHPAPIPLHNAPLAMPAVTADMSMDLLILREAMPIAGRIVRHLMRIVTMTADLVRNAPMPTVDARAALLTMNVDRIGVPRAGTMTIGGMTMIAHGDREREPIATIDPKPDKPGARSQMPP